MTTEQKLREALQALLASGGVIAEAADDELQAAIDDPDAEEIVKVQAAAVLNARQALATTEPTSKQPLQVEPAVNQQLTTEPIDEREAFEYEMRKRCNWSPNQFIRSPFQHDDYAEQASQDAWEAWQARAAMAKGVKG